MEEEKISFSYVTNVLVETVKGSVWVRVFALTPDLEDVGLVKEQIEKGNEARAKLNGLREYFEKENELCLNKKEQY